jgi:hypothetical protein
MLDAATKTAVAIDAPETLRDTSPNPLVKSFFNRTASHESPGQKDTA